MKYLDAAFAEPAYNLACDEVLLELVEGGQIDDDLLRIWEPKTHFVVLGHANSFRSEVNLRECEVAGIAMFRRMSGGGTVIQGPGCLNYSLILNDAARRFGNIGAVFRHVLGRHRDLIEALTGKKARIEGISDLAISGRKVSGNAQYRKSCAVLVHGTFLLHFDLSVIDRCLQVPAKQPAYRRDRPHVEFLANLDLDASAMRGGLVATWQANNTCREPPLDRMHALVRERYGRKDWSERF
jgi:lipoate---protein ligase